MTAPAVIAGLGCWFCGEPVLTCGATRMGVKGGPTQHVADAGCVECDARYIAWCAGDGRVVALSFRSTIGDLPTWRDWPRWRTAKRAPGRACHIAWRWFDNQHHSRQDWEERGKIIACECDECRASKRPPQAATGIPWHLSHRGEPEAPKELGVGSVAMHLDRGKQHMAIILETAGREAFALFLTSNPSWSKGSRPATKDELALAGAHTSRATYLAPAIRLSVEFERVNAVDFPEHRIESLRAEFPRWRELL